MVVLIWILLVWAVVCGALIKFAENRIDAIERDITFFHKKIFADLGRLEKLERIVYVALQKPQQPKPVGHINEELAERVKAQHESLKTPPPKPGTLDFPKGGISYPPDFMDKEGNEYIAPLSKLKEFINSGKPIEMQWDGIKSKDELFEAIKQQEKDISEWQNETLQLIPPNVRGFKWPGEYEKGKGGYIFGIRHIGPYKIMIPKETGKTIEEAKAFVGNYGRKTFVVKDGCLVRNLSRDTSVRGNIDASGYAPNQDGHFGEIAY